MEVDGAGAVTDSDEAADLAERACHDREAFAALYELHYPRVFNYVMRTTMNVAAAEDIVSVTFLKALNGLQHYEQRGHRFESWLYRIATNTMMDHFRRHKRDTAYATDLSYSANSPGVELAPGCALEQLEQYEALHNAISRLKDVYRITVVLHYFEEKPLKEIAEITGCTVATAKWRLHRARKQLSRILPKETLNHE